MDKNHSRNFSEEQLDKLARNILHSTILTDEEVNEIADSSRLWRQLQSCVADEKSRREQRWFFGWQTATVGALAILTAAGVAFWIFNSPKTETAAIEDKKIVVPATEELKPIENKPGAQQSNVSPVIQTKISSVKTERLLSKNSPKIKSTRVRPAYQKIEKRKDLPAQKAEAATEFIALSYLPATESGQIVRVKVPRSMMVSLGVTTNVEKNSELVNAEVILGDDGAARAIRFLGQ